MAVILLTNFSLKPRIRTLHLCLKKARLAISYAGETEQPKPCVCPIPVIRLFFITGANTLRVLAVLLLSAFLWVNPAHAAPINRAVAVVNGEMITSYDLSAAVAPELLRAGLDPKKEKDKAAITALERQVLENMINDIVVTQEAERLKVGVSDSDVDEELRRFKDGAQMDEAAFASELKRQKIELSSFRERLRKNLLKNRLLGAMVGRKVLVSKEEIAQYYETNRGVIGTAQPVGGMVNVAILLYPTQAAADTWVPRIKSGKAAFENVVREVSVGPMKEQGGELGLMSLQDMAPVLRDQVSKLTPGQVSAPLKVDGGVLQVKLLTKNADAAPSGGVSMSIEEATPEIERILRESKMQDRYMEYMEQLRKRAMVDIRL